MDAYLSALFFILKAFENQKKARGEGWLAQVTVYISGRSYRMACEDGQEAQLRALAESFDNEINVLRSVFGEIGDQRLTVMAGIKVYDEMSSLKTRLETLEAEVESIRAERSIFVNKTSEQDEKVVQAIETTADRISEIAQKVLNATQRESEILSYGDRPVAAEKESKEDLDKGMDRLL